MPVYYISILRARQSFDPCAFALCSSSRLSPIFCPLLLSPLCRNALARALLFVASFLSPFRFFIAAMCRGAFVRTSICAAFTCRFFPRPRACAFCCLRTDGESLRAKKTAPLTDQEITLAAKNKTNPRIGQIRQYRGICRPRKRSKFANVGNLPPARRKLNRPRKTFGSRQCRASAARIAVKSRQRRCVCRADRG